MQTNRKEFLELLQRYIGGTCSSEEKQMMDYWYDLLDQEHDENDGKLSGKQLEDLLWAKMQHRIQSKNTTDKHAAVLKGRQNDD